MIKNLHRSFFKFLSLLIILKLFYWFYTPVNADEAYYWLWGQHPALSYHDHPGLQAWVQHLFYLQFGNSLFALRLPTILCFLVCWFVYSKILNRISKRNENRTSILVFFSIPIVFILGSFAWNDYLMVTNVLISAYFWMGYLTDRWNKLPGKTAELFLAFIFLGLAAISKNNSVFLALAIVSIIVSKKQFHSILLDYRFYLGILICMIIVSPIFIWNSNNQNGSFQFNLIDRTITPLLEGRFFKGNILGFALGSFFLVPPVLWIYGFREYLSTKEEKKLSRDAFEFVFETLAYHLFFWSSLTFFILSLFSNVLFYWNLPAYLLILPFWIFKILEKNARLFKPIFYYSLIVNILFLFHYSILPLNSILLKEVDRDTAYLYGWKNITQKIGEISANYTNKPQILTSSYNTASILSFELNNSTIQSYSYRFDQFDYWTKEKQYNTKEAIILTEKWNPMNADLEKIIENSKLLDSLQIVQFGHPILKYYFYKADIKEAYLKKQ